MLDVVLCIVALVAGGLVVELFAAARAPIGYEDEQGFHFGSPVLQGPDVSVLSTNKPVPASAPALLSGRLAPAHSV